MRQPVEEWLGADVLTVEDGKAVLRMTVTDQHVNGAGYVHGGVLFALADAALAHAVIIPSDGATVSAHVSFIAPASPGDELTAVARTRTQWGSNSLVDVTLRCNDRTIAEFQGQARLPRR